MSKSDEQLLIENTINILNNSRHEATLKRETLNFNRKLKGLRQVITTNLAFIAEKLKSKYRDVQKMSPTYVNDLEAIRKTTEDILKFLNRE